ncbi:hypothetical protein T265_04484 [Opisthorchis viverrini]|uniref:Uncharacterized protein n=1 Tax=Opisthorchis viverrini TaxID=6198 RepID=A0A074ZNW1_OPIVI|nr:hypothetical protein T265_04484 [Opisthorchis viverrini]KER28796.1 hypothetical protein T265_04484 [Opisthorchis viverrini]
MHFAPTQCKVTLVDVQSLNTPLTSEGEALEVVERFTHLGSHISSDCSVTDEVNERICKARAAFANLRHLWRQDGLSLNLKERIYQAAVRVVSLYDDDDMTMNGDDDDGDDDDGDDDDDDDDDGDDDADDDDDGDDGI